MDEMADRKVELAADPERAGRMASGPRPCGNALEPRFRTPNDGLLEAATDPNP
jgi:hypothetical protein